MDEVFLKWFYGFVSNLGIGLSIWWSRRERNEEKESSLETRRMRGWRVMGKIPKSTQGNYRGNRPGQSPALHEKKSIIAELISQLRKEEWEHIVTIEVGGVFLVAHRERQ